MEPNLPWYRSAIIRQQIVAFLLAAFGLFKFKTDLDIDATVAAILGGVAAIIPVWTILTRLFKPNPNMTQTAANKEAAMKKTGDMPTEPIAVAPPKQGGFFRPAFAFVLFGSAVFAVAMLNGCAVNPHKTAQTVEQHGDAVYGEITILKEQGAKVLEDATVADGLKRPIAEAIVAAKPVTDGLQDTLILYARVFAEVKAGASTPDKLAVVDRQLAGWIAQAQPIISKLAAALEGAGR